MMNISGLEGKRPPPLIERAVVELRGELALRAGYSVSSNDVNHTITLQHESGSKLLFIMSAEDKFWVYDMEYQQRAGSVKLLQVLEMDEPGLMDRIQAEVDNSIERHELWMRNRGPAQGFDLPICNAGD